MKQTQLILSQQFRRGDAPSPELLLAALRLWLSAAPAAEA